MYERPLKGRFLNSFRVLWTLLTSVLVLAVSGTPAAAVTSLSLGEAYEMALESNHEIRSAAEAVEQGEILQKQAITVLYPNLTALASYSRETYEDGSDGDGSNWGISLNQTIYNGGRVWVAKRGARLTLEAARMGLDFARQSTLMDLVSRSYQLLSAKDLLKVSEKRVERVREQLRQAQARLEVGDAPRTDVLAARVALSSVQLDQVEAQKAVALARTRLSNLIGLKEPVEVLLPGTVVLPPGLSLDSLVGKALEARPDLSQVRELVRISTEEAELVRRGGHPNVDLFGSWMQYSEESSFYPETQVGVSLTWPFFQGGLVKLQTREAESRTRQAEELYGRQADAARLEVEEALLSLEALEAQRQLVADNIQTASEHHRLALSRFELGSATSLEVLDAEEDLAEAEYLEVNHKYETRTARAALLYSIGALDLEDFVPSTATERLEK